MSTTALERRARLASTLSRRLREPEARERLAGAIAAVAAAALYPVRVPREQADLLLAAQVATVTSATVDALIHELGDVVVALSELTVDAALTQQRIVDLGIE